MCLVGRLSIPPVPLTALYLAGMASKSMPAAGSHARREEEQDPAMGAVEGDEAMDGAEEQDDGYSACFI